MPRNKTIKVDGDEHEMLNDVASEWLGSASPQSTPFGYTIRLMAERKLRDLRPRESVRTAAGERTSTVRLYPYEYALLEEVATRWFGTPDIPFGHVVRMLELETLEGLESGKINKFDNDYHQNNVLDEIAGMDEVNERADELGADGKKAE